MTKLYKTQPYDDFKWGEYKPITPKYRYYEEYGTGTGVQPVPWVTTTTTTTPVYQEQFSIKSEDDTNSEIVYTYLVERGSTTPFSLESIKIELLGVLAIQKGELLSILVQMVSDGILSFNRKTATYTFNQ